MMLVIGNKNYSSWSMRPWVLLTHFSVPFSEHQLWLDTPEFKRDIASISPTRRVPVLHDKSAVIWDSLAICEYVNECYLQQKAWPADMQARAQARCIAAEMHSGFAALRSQLPMNCRRSPKARHWDQAAQADINRVISIWETLREAAQHASAQPYLFGEFSIADAMFAPVVVRFSGYGVELPERSLAYQQAMLAAPGVSQWMAAGVAETQRLPHEEV